MLVTSRSFEEYRAFFALDDRDLRGRILDCCAGASGFAAAAGRSGPRVVAVDPAYADPAAVTAQAEAALVVGDAIIAAAAGPFTWRWYGDPERRAAMRRRAAADFLADFEARPDRYRTGALPDLPFDDRAFDLVLCSHLLFTWSDVLDARWHAAAVRELARVGREVRVFPLVVQRTGEDVPFLADLVAGLREEGFEAGVEAVPYEFQVGGDRMLRIRSVP